MTTGECRDLTAVDLLCRYSGQGIMVEVMFLPNSVRGNAGVELCSRSCSEFCDVRYGTLNFVPINGGELTAAVRVHHIDYCVSVLSCYGA